MAKKAKRADGRYAKQVTIGYKDGKPIKKTVYGKTTGELEKKYREMMFLIDKGFILKNDDMRVSELYDVWFKIKKSSKVKRDNTRKSYSTISNHIKNSIGNLKVKDVTLFAGERLIAEQGEHTRTAMGIIRVLNSMLDYAVRSNIIAVNPCKELTVNYAPPKKRALSDCEKANIEVKINELPDRQKIYFLLLRYTGMRKGEVLALERNDIDRNGLTIKVNKTLIDCVHPAYIQDLTKTPAGERIIPIFVPLIKPLFEYLDKLKGDYLFKTRNGKFISNSQSYDWYRQIRDRLGIDEDITAHGMRHNFISECYYGDIDILTAQALAGHKHSSTTSDIYTDIADKYIDKSRKLNDYYGSQTEVKNKSNENQTPLKLVK